jgi:DNA-binding Lrp family transcriptional regulator
MADSTERRILNELYNDADRSRKVIGKRVGLSEPSLSKRISELRADGVIKNFSINIDYAKVGFNTSAFTLIRLHDQHKEKATALVEKLSKLNEAVEVYTVLGTWDVYVRWLCHSPAQVMALIKDTLLSEESVGHTETITLAEESKREHGPAL